jgi:hypothetical protein
MTYHELLAPLCQSPPGFLVLRTTHCGEVATSCSAQFRWLFVGNLFARHGKPLLQNPSLAIRAARGSLSETDRKIRRR